MPDGIAKSRERVAPYHLEDSDRSGIAQFEFRLANNLQAVSDAVGWIQDFPHAKVLQRNIENLQNYFDQRAAAMGEAVAQLSTSTNPDVQAMLEPLKAVQADLIALTAGFKAFLQQPSAEAAHAMQQLTRELVKKLRVEGDRVGNNPAYRAFRDQQGEAQRVTIEFDLEYDEAA